MESNALLKPTEVGVRNLRSPELDTPVTQRQPERTSIGSETQRHGISSVQVPPPTPIAHFATLSIEDA